MQARKPLEVLMANHAPKIEAAVRAGWKRENAIACEMLIRRRRDSVLW